MPNSTIAAQRLAATAKALAACCRENRTDEGLDALYADDVVSVEPVSPTGGGPRTTIGLEALRDKHAAWFKAVELHDCRCEGPFYNGEDRFGLIFSTEAAFRATGEPNNSRELAIYTVNDEGRIVREEFFEDV